MKKFPILVLLFLLAAQSFAQKNEEFRATWVITWDHISSSSSVAQNKARVRRILDDHVKANMTSVLWQVRQGGTAYYESSYEPWGSYAGKKHPGYDPLAYAIEEAHKRGLELHAWFNTFHTSSTDPGTPVAEHPEWVCTDKNGNPMTSYRSISPGMEAVREYTINVAMEIVRNYDIDGFHLDYVRWNEYDTGDMDPDATDREQVSVLDGEKILEKMKTSRDANAGDRYIFDTEHPFSEGVPEGFTSWDDWRRWSTTEFVRVLHDSIQSVKPWVRLSPAALGKYKEGGVNGWNGYYVVFQDAAKWFNEGYVDQLTPMHYHWLSGSSFKSTLSSDWRPNIQEGIDAGRLYTVGPGSYILLSNNVWGNHENIVKDVRDLEWTDGYQFFSYGEWYDLDYFDEAAEKFFIGKSKVRDINTVFTPDAPTLSIEKIDSLRYDITVTTADTLSENYWFALYRSEDDIFDPETDQIVNVAFNDSSYVYEEGFLDAANFHGTYTYFATMFNRYWNESAASNSVGTDTVLIAEPMPDAPVVEAAYNVSENKIGVQFRNVEFADEYVVYYGQDRNNLTDSVVTKDTLAFVEGLETNKPYYVKVAAKNIRGISTTGENVFMAAPSADPYEVLIVDGFDRGTNARYDYVTFYSDPVTFDGRGFAYILNEYVNDAKVSLLNYDNVIWILGDESTADETFSDAEQNIVKEYLENGGHLFVTGSEIGWDLDEKATGSDKFFYNNYLKAGYVADAPGNESGTYYNAEPVAGGIFNGMSVFSFDDGTHGTIDVDWPDAIEPLDGAKSELLFAGAPAASNIAGISYQGMFPDGTTAGKLVYLSVPFETIYPENIRLAVMSNVLDWFDIPVSVEENETGLPVAYELSKNYPNPFNPSTTIRFALPQSEHVTIEVFNTLGEKVTELVNREMTAGRHTVEFNASSLASGIYIYTMRAGSFNASDKMILLK